MTHQEDAILQMISEMPREDRIKLTETLYKAYGKDSSYLSSFEMPTQRIPGANIGPRSDKPLNASGALLQKGQGMNFIGKMDTGRPQR